MNRALALSGLLVVLASCSAGKAPSPIVLGEVSSPVVPAAIADPKQSEAEYELLVAKVKAAPAPEDVKRLREVYVQTNRYQPYGADGFPPDQAFDAADAERWAECRSLADETLERNYTNMYAHFAAMVCNRKDSRENEAARHEAIVTQLIDAIHESGDGKTMGTAFVTYSTPELKAFLQLQGLENLGQALSDEDGQWFDVMSVKDPNTGKEFSLYFNITHQWSRYTLK